MLNIVTYFCFVVVLNLHLCKGLLKPVPADIKVNNIDKKPLKLTNLIQQGKIKEAQEAAKVVLDGAENIVSFAAYLTVNALYDSNIFFWFFPSRHNSTEDPVILWLQGEPGVSSLFGLFVEHGPFFVTDDIKLHLRDKSWIDTHSIIYMDHAVGTGFSFGAKQKKKQSIDVGRDLYEALLQLFQLFPDLQETDFFISGESYAGLYGPALGYIIMENNYESKIPIRLRGLTIGNGFIDPINQFDYGDFLFRHGLIDSQQISAFQCDARMAWMNVKFGLYKRAAEKIEQIYERYANLTQLNLFNYIDDLKLLASLDENYRRYIVRPSTRSALHVGEGSFDEVTSIDTLSSTRFQSAVPWITRLLNHYRILIYTGHLDVIVNYMTVMKYMEQLKFADKAVFKNAIRNKWIIGDDVAGYVRVVGNLTEVMVRNAGHVVPFDQPLWAFDMIYKFIRNLDFNTSINSN